MNESRASPSGLATRAEVSTWRLIAKSLSSKFIAWRGGAETIRQNGLFIDIFRLALAETERRKVVYLTGLDHPLRFLRGRRALRSVLSKSSSAAARFRDAYGDRYAVVSDYWRDVSGTVEVVDLLPLVPVLGDLPPDDKLSPSPVP